MCGLCAGSFARTACACPKVMCRVMCGHLGVMCGLCAGTCVEKVARTSYVQSYVRVMCGPFRPHGVRVHKSYVRSYVRVMCGGRGPTKTREELLEPNNGYATSFEFERKRRLETSSRANAMI